MNCPGGKLRKQEGILNKMGTDPFLRYGVRCRVIALAVFFVITSVGAAGVKDSPKKTVKFNFDENVRKVKIVGTFGKEEKVVAISMVKLFGGFHVNMKLAPGFYLYRYLIGKSKYVTDSFGEIYREDGIKYSLLRVWPDGPEAFLHLASDLIAKNREEWAIDTFIEGIRRFQGEIRLYSALGDFYEGQKWFGFAADCYHSYLEKFPEDVEMRYRIASCYEKYYLDTGKKKHRKGALFHWKRLLGTKYNKEAMEHLRK